MCEDLEVSLADPPLIRHCSPVSKLQLPSKLFVTLSFIQLDHPTYHRYQTYGKYYLFLNLKNRLCGVQTMNDSSLWWKPGWRDRHETLYDVTSYNDFTSTSSSYKFQKNMHVIGV